MSFMQLQITQRGVLYTADCAKCRDRKRANGIRVWKIETCRACGGSGQIEDTRRQLRRDGRITR